MHTMPAHAKKRVWSAYHAHPSPIKRRAQIAYHSNPSPIKRRTQDAYKANPSPIKQRALDVYKAITSPIKWRALEAYYKEHDFTKSNRRELYKRKCAIILDKHCISKLVAWSVSKKYCKIHDDMSASVTKFVLSLLKKLTENHMGNSRQMSTKGSQLQSGFGMCLKLHFEA